MERENEFANENQNPRRTSASFDESAIRLLEKHWGDLRQQAAIASDSEGWKLRLHTPQSLFERLGFRDGQAISPETLLERSRGKDAIPMDIVERWLALFEHLGMKAGV